MVSHFPSKNPAKRRSALRTSTEISWPWPVACLQSAATATLLAARPTAASVPNRIGLGRIGSDPQDVSLPPASAVVSPMSSNISLVVAGRSKYGDVAGWLTFCSRAFVNIEVDVLV